MDDRLVGRQAQYDGHAEAYAHAAADSPYNAGIDRPAVMSLLGDVTGLRVLDAGCGPGLYAGELTNHGAQVVGFDQSPEMVALARSRVPTGQFRVHDLADPLDWSPDNSFHRVLLALVIHYIDDRAAALGELHRVLEPGGMLVLSTHHPTKDWLSHGGSYFDATVVEDEWASGWLVRYWRQPLEQSLAEFSAAGFALDRLVEPRPVAGMATRYPSDYAGANNRPVFIAFRLRK